MIARPAGDSSQERRRFAAVVGLSVLWHLAVVAAIGLWQPFERARETGVVRAPIAVEMVTRRDFVLAQRQEVGPAAERPDTAVDPAAEDGPEAPRAPTEAARPRAAAPTAAASAEPPAEADETRPEAAPLQEAAPKGGPQDALAPSRDREAGDLAATADDAAALAAASEDPATAATASQSPEALASVPEQPPVAVESPAPATEALPSAPEEPPKPAMGAPEALRTARETGEPHEPAASEAEAASPRESRVAELKGVQEAASLPGPPTTPPNVRAEAGTPEPATAAGTAPPPSRPVARQGPTESSLAAGQAQAPRATPAPKAAEVTVEAEGLQPTARQVAEARPSDAAPAPSAEAPPPSRAATASDDAPSAARAAASVPDPAGVADEAPQALQRDERIAAAAAAEDTPSRPASRVSSPDALAARPPDPVDAGARPTGQAAADLAQTAGGPDPVPRARQAPEAPAPADPASTAARTARVAASPTRPARPPVPTAARQATRQARAMTALDTSPGEAPSREQATPPDLRSAKDTGQPSEAVRQPSRVAQAAAPAATTAKSPSETPRTPRRTTPSEAIEPATSPEVSAQAEPARPALSSGPPAAEAAPAERAAESSAVSPTAGEVQVARAAEAGGAAASPSAASGADAATPSNGTPPPAAKSSPAQVLAQSAQTPQAPSRLLTRAPADAAALAPRRAAPDDAAGRSATLGGMLSQVLATMPCAHATLEAGAGAGRYALRGYVPSAGGRQRVLARMTELLGPSRVDAGELAVVERPHCATLSGIAETGIDHHPALDGKGTATGVVRRYLSDDTVELKLTTPEFPAYLYVDYFDRQGRVIHLVPNLYGGAMRFEPDSTVRIGGDDRLTASPPYGIDLVVAVASGKPLFNEMRPQTESAARYLDALRNAIARRRSADAWHGAYSYILVETAPRLGGRAQAEGG